MRDHQGQASVEWTGLALLVALVLAAGAAGALHVAGSGLAKRLACRIANDGCAPRPTLAELGRRGFVFEGRLPVHSQAGPLAVAGALAPGTALRSVGRWLYRHRRLVRKVVIGAAVGVGAAATCVGAMVVANAIGGAMCASSIVTGAYAAYQNASD